MSTQDTKNATTMQSKNTSAAQNTTASQRDQVKAELGKIIFALQAHIAKREQSKSATSPQSNDAEVKSGKKAIKRTPRYKFDETWTDAINRCHDDAHSATDLTNLIRQYIEGTGDCSELYDTRFGCAWVVIKAEIDRRKARNARARERRLQRRAEKLAALQDTAITSGKSAIAKKDTPEDSATSEKNATNKATTIVEKSAIRENSASNNVAEQADEVIESDETIEIAETQVNTEAQTGSEAQTDTVSQLSTEPQSYSNIVIAKPARKPHKRHHSKKKHSKHKR
jgi:hypothetical protein